jgi:translation initiation factor eIF-2B subunit gamma
MSATQGVVFALGGEKRFGGLVTQDSPRCLLDLGFQPMAWYALRALERANVLDVFLVAAGEHSAARFEDFVREQYKGPCRVAVVAAAEDADSADALRAVANRLTSRSVAVLSGDLVTDVALADVLDTHDSAGAGAVATCVYARRRPWNAVETKTGRPPKGATYVGLGDDKRLLFAANGDDVDKILKLRRPMLHRVSSLEVRTDLSDANMYVFRTSVVLRLLRNEPRMRSLQLDAVPALARRQFVQSSDDADDVVDADDDAGLMRAVFGGVEKNDVNRSASSFTCTVLAYLAPDAAYCARAETLSPAYSEMARELAAADAAAHLLGRPASKYENFVDGSVAIGARATVGPGCIVGKDATLGEKCSVKRSVVGEGASIGSGVKLINSVVMPRATVEDGCVVQGCVVGPRAVIGAGTSLRECRVAAEYEVDEGDDFRGETLAEKTR